MDCEGMRIVAEGGAGCALEHEVSLGTAANTFQRGVELACAVQLPLRESYVVEVQEDAAGMVVQAFNSSTLEAEARGSL